MNKQRLMEIIAEEIGCPSLASGEHPPFKFCNDRNLLNPRTGKRGECFCEKAALRILELQKDPTP